MVTECPSLPGLSEQWTKFCSTNSRIYLLECPFFCAGGMKGVPHPSVRQQRVALVLDGENCLDRLYGGYFPNWVCGGQVRQQLLSTLSVYYQILGITDSQFMVKSNPLSKGFGPAPQDDFNKTTQCTCKGIRINLAINLAINQL